MTTQLSDIFINDSQLFKAFVYDVDGVTPLTPLSCTCSIWNKDTNQLVAEAQTGTVGSGYAQYNWSGSAIGGNYEAVLTIVISIGVVKSENFSIRVLPVPTDLINILTATEASRFIRSTATDPMMLQYLPLIDQYLLNATGHDWTTDATIHPTAKIAAGMLLCYWYDNPGAVGTAPDTVINQLVQLEAEALNYRKYAFEGLASAGAIYLPNARKGDHVEKLVGVYGGLSGDQSSKFESVISEEGQIQQTPNGLFDKGFVVVLKDPADDVSA
jgi:hypothetical protein